MLNQIAGAPITRIQINHSRNVTRKIIPHPPFFIFKTLHNNSSPRRKAGRRNQRIPASFQNEARIRRKPAMCATTHALSRNVRINPSPASPTAWRAAQVPVRFPNLAEGGRVAQASRLRPGRPQTLLAALYRQASLGRSRMSLVLARLSCRSTPPDLSTSLPSWLSSGSRVATAPTGAPSSVCAQYQSLP